MRSDRYVHVPSPWKAAIGMRTAAPARFYTELVAQALRYGLPAKHRFGAAYAAAARSSAFPARAIARSLRRVPKRDRPDLDSMIRSVSERWTELAAESVRLDTATPPDSALALERSAGLTVFLFAGDDHHPLVVAKVPPEGDDRVDLEVRALQAAASSGVAPRFLGTVAGARVQEGIPGAPLPVVPTGPKTAESLWWQPLHGEVGNTLSKLAEATAAPGMSWELNEDSMKAALAYDMPTKVRDRVHNAYRDAVRVDVTVLRHVDTSPQNCLLHRQPPGVSLVDWEIARFEGVPGFDLLTAALSYMEHGVGLQRWSEDLIVETFEIAWSRSHYWKTARTAIRQTMSAAGVDDKSHDALELLFFAQRVGLRVTRPDYFPTSADMAARMLNVVARD